MEWRCLYFVSIARNSIFMLNHTFVMNIIFFYASFSNYTCVITGFVYCVSLTKTTTLDRLGFDTCEYSSKTGSKLGDLFQYRCGSQLIKYRLLSNFEYVNLQLNWTESHYSSYIDEDETHIRRVQ